MRLNREAAPVVVAWLLVAGCGAALGEAATNADRPAFTESEATTKVAYTTRDYFFEGPTVVKGPDVFFTADNEGSEDHELEVLAANGRVVGQIKPFSAGRSAEPLAARLAPGTYTLQCGSKTSAGRVHRDLGMVVKLTIE